MQNETKNSSQPIPSPTPQDLNQSSLPPTALQGKMSLFPQGSRAERRSAAKKKKKGLAPLMPSDSRLLHQRVGQSESALQRLGDAFDQNSEVFSESIKMLEVMGVVMQRCMNDMLNQTVRCFGDKLSGAPNEVPLRSSAYPQIDFNSYLREYWLCMLMADFARWCGTIATHDEPLIASVSKTDVIEFGG